MGKIRDLFTANDMTVGTPWKSIAQFAFPMLIVQALVNSFGDAMLVAANVMVMRVDGYAMLPNFSFGQAMGTYAGQNVGAGDTTSPMWITIFTTVFLRIPLAYGLVALTRSMGAPVLTQEKMIFVSLLSVWVMGAVITTVVYFHGGWRKKILRFGNR